MESARILVAMGNDSSLEKMKDVLNGYGYQIVDTARNAGECLRKMRYLKPDLSVLDYGLRPQNGFEIARVADEDDLCDVILIVSREQKDQVDYGADRFNLAVFTKPVSREELFRTIDIMIKNRRKIMRLEQEVQDLRKTLDSRKEVEKAKGILMKNMNLTEEQAFRMIQRQSMNRGIQMKEIARAIILANDLENE